MLFWTARILRAHEAREASGPEDDDPSVRCADTSPAELGRHMKAVG